MCPSRPVAEEHSAEPRPRAAAIATATPCVAARSGRARPPRRGVGEPASSGRSLAHRRRVSPWSEGKMHAASAASWQHGGLRLRAPRFAASSIIRTCWGSLQSRRFLVRQSGRAGISGTVRASELQHALLLRQRHHNGAAAGAGAGVVCCCCWRRSSCGCWRRRACAQVQTQARGVGGGADRLCTRYHCSAACVVAGMHRCLKHLMLGMAWPASAPASAAAQACAMQRCRRAGAAHCVRHVEPKRWRLFG